MRKSTRLPVDTVVSDLEPPARKVFNCIVDETALIAGVKRSTRDGIAKWIANGAIRLFIPLYTLGRLDIIKRAKDRKSADARDTLGWLDDVTAEDLGSVRLQGGYEMYESWADVEKFLLPATLLSIEDDVDVEANSDLVSMGSECSVEILSSSPRSVSTVPDQGSLTNTLPIASKPIESSPPVVPPYLQPLFNHLLWRIHQDPSSDFGAENFILLSNDPKKQTVAQKFGIRAKRLEQLREAVLREDRDYKNRLQFFRRETQEDEVELKRPERTASAKPTGHIWDPNEFGRAPRGRGPSRSRSDKPHSPGLIDPNSFARPPPEFHRARGGSRRLWEPT